ncbi:MAG: hypothetical protein M3Z32_03530 [Acidobacteriota bacterium]|nr:hypothetical protein [Acidobacteriota bacterium]
MRMLLTFSIACFTLACQDAWMGDRDVMQELRADGVRYDRASASIYFEKDAMTPEEMDAFANLVEQGIEDIEGLLKIPDGRRRSQSGKVFFFVSGKIDIGRSRVRTVMLPLWRVQKQAAPYLHETAHIIAPCESCPMWFSEGFVSWVQSHVSENLRGYDAKVFARRGNRGVDADAARYLSTAQGQAVLPFVLEGGEPPDIVAERRAVGAPFYVLSQSLVKYLVEQAGIEKIMALSDSEHFDAELARVMAKTPEEVKRDWLTAVRGARLSQASQPTPIVLASPQ